MTSSLMEETTASNDTNGDGASTKLEEAAPVVQGAEDVREEPPPPPAAGPSSSLEEAVFSPSSTSPAAAAEDDAPSGGVSGAEEGAVATEATTVALAATTTTTTASHETAAEEHATTTSAIATAAVVEAAVAEAAQLALADHDATAAVATASAAAEAATVAAATAAAAAAAAAAAISQREQDDAADAAEAAADREDLEAVKPSIEVDLADQPRHASTSQKRRPDGVSERDVVLNRRDDNPKMHLLLEDLVHLHHVLWQLQGKTDPPTETELHAAATRAVRILKGGKIYELCGLRDVPRPFLRSPGRILERDVDTPSDDIAGALREVSDEEAIAKIQALLASKVQKEPLGERLKESPYREFQRRLERNAAHRRAVGDAATTDVQVGFCDAVLSRCGSAEPTKESLTSTTTTSSEGGEGGSGGDGSGDAKVVFNVGPQQVLFNLAAQIVTTYTINAETQVKAAVAVLNGLDETDFAMASAATDGVPPGTRHPRFVLRNAVASPPSGTGGGGAGAPDAGGGESSSFTTTTTVVATPPPATWSLVSDADALEWAVTFVFEVHLEKDLDYMTAMLPSDHKQSATEDQSKVPIKGPTKFDVLFGRGGMTNSHVGNRRFRDIIALHRPDYIRAIKMDKPAVARKIVKAIRFLKKSQDGNWYDVGDRTAAEKTSQGLRERTNAEKRQRSQLRRALRLRREDLEDDDEYNEDGAEHESSSNKRARVGDRSGDAANLAAALAPTLNYVGTNLGVPLSLNMAPVVQVPVAKKKVEAKTKLNSLGLNTEGLPPNAVDEDGNILVTDYDILLGRGGLTNHHKGNKRFRDIVALHRSDYVRAPKIQKPSVARVIVRAIRNGDPPGRFLRKDEKSGKWIDVGDKKAAEKTSQALREKAIEEREKIKSEPGAVGILVPTPASYLDATTANVIGNILASGTFKGTEGENVVTAAAAATTTTTAAASAAAATTTTTATTTTAVEKEEQGTTDAPEAAAPEAKDAEKNEAGAIANEAPAVIAQVEV